MNPIQKARFQKVADWLLAGAPHVQLNDKVSLTEFDYHSWVKVNDCGTTACIAGAVVEFEYADRIKLERDGYGWTTNLSSLLPHPIEDEAQELLGLSGEQTQLLFYPFDLDPADPELPEEYRDCGKDFPLDWTLELPPETVGRVVQHFIDTGEIDWELAQPEEDEC